MPVTWSGIVSTDSKESIILKIPHPTYSARTGEKFPLIFNAINEIFEKKGKKKIHWI